MKPKDLRERSLDDLKELEKSLAKDVFQNRFKNFTNRLDDTSSIGKARKDLARVKTLLRQHALGTVPVTLPGEGGEAKPKPAKKAAKPKAEAKSAAPAKTAQRPLGKKAAAPKKKSSAKKEE
jgi:large subunit ribosomal protein L29